MRLAATLVLASASLLFQASAQTPPTDLFQSMKVDVTVVVKKHPTGAEMVEVTAGADDYPEAVLKDQVARIGEGLNVSDRGLMVFRQQLGTTAKTSLLKATFATNGILAGNEGIRLQPIARAFAGAQGPGSVQGIDVILIGQPATSNTLPMYDSPAVHVQGQTTKDPGMIEYRILLKTQDPAKITIPDRLDQMPAAPAKETGQSEISPILKWGLVVIAALATGGLVYNLALRGPSRTQRR